MSFLEKKVLNRLVSLGRCCCPTLEPSNRPESPPLSRRMASPSKKGMDAAEDHRRERESPVFPQKNPPKLPTLPSARPTRPGRHLGASPRARAALRRRALAPASLQHVRKPTRAVLMRESAARHEKLAENVTNPNKATIKNPLGSLLPLAPLRRALRRIDRPHLLRRQRKSTTSPAAAPSRTACSIYDLIT